MSNVQALAPVPQAPPYNAEIEAALLGALLTNAGAYDYVADILIPEHFYEPVHGRIYDAIARQAESGKSTGPQALAHFFDNDEGLIDAGGGRYLYELAASVISVVNVKDYAAMIVELATAREALPLLESMAAELRSPVIDLSAQQVLQRAAETIDGLIDRERDQTTHNLAESAMAAAEEIEAACEAGRGLTGLATGLVDLDRKTAGLQDGDLILLAGRPSSGKTALAGTIALSVAKMPDPDTEVPQPVLMFSVEMGHEQVTKRLIAAEAGLPFDRLRSGRLSAEERLAVREAAASLGRYPLVIDDTPAQTVARIRARARRYRRKHGLALLVIDYLQILSASAEARRYGNKVQEVSEMTRQLKALARELQVPVLCLSQLSRQVENREDKRPQLADLRDSGAIEQDADVVMFIYREYYYLQKAEPVRGQFKSDGLFDEAFAQWGRRCTETKNLVEIGMAKQRQGPTGTVKLFADLELMRFGNLKQEDML